MNEFYNKHYIKVDTRGHIISGWSNGPCSDKDVTGAICINEQGGYQFRLFQAGEENPDLYTFDGIPLYKWDGEGAVRRTEDEIAAERASWPAPEPTKEQLLWQAITDLEIAQMEQLQQMTDLEIEVKTNDQLV